MQALPLVAIGLFRKLQNVAAVGEHRGGGGKHDGQAGTAGEAGQPGQAFGRGRNILTEVLVGLGTMKPSRPWRASCFRSADNAELSSS